MKKPHFSEIGWQEKMTFFSTANESKVLSWKTLLHLTGSKPYFELCLAAWKDKFWTSSDARAEFVGFGGEGCLSILDGKQPWIALHTFTYSVRIWHWLPRDVSPLITEQRGMCKWAQHFEQRRSVVVALQQQYKYIEAVVVCLWWYSVAAVAEIASQQLISIIINISPILIG